MDPGSSLTFDWVAIPGGRARIGAAGTTADGVPAVEQPASTVVLAVFSIGRTPVTNAAYARFVAATGHRAPAHWEGPHPPPTLERHPVTYVDRRDVLALQFHAEADSRRIAQWLIGHTCELSAAGSDTPALRAQSQEVGSGLRAAGTRMLADWLEQLSW